MTLEMCTANDEKTKDPWGTYEPVARKGSKCVSACTFEGGEWGTSYCKTSTTNGEWGGECVPCSGNITIM